MNHVMVMSKRPGPMEAPSTFACHFFSRFLHLPLFLLRSHGRFDSLFPLFSFWKPLPYLGHIALVSLATFLPLSNPYLRR